MPGSLERFLEAHQRDFETALEETRQGRKISHWMWYIFPQLKGLASSYTSAYYGIKNLGEAREFLANPVLGKNILTISAILLQLKTDDATLVFGKPDDIKLQSSMTLFSRVSGTDIIFQQVLNKYFKGKADTQTIKLLM